MVYCSKCGAQNADDAVNCSKCGAPLNTAQPNDYWGPRYYRHYRSRGSFVGIIIGLLIMAVGVSSLIGVNIWDWLWPAFLILIGLAIISGSVYSRRW